MKNINKNVQNDPLLPKILNEIGQAQEGTQKRQELIKKFQEESEKNDGKKHKLLVYIAKMSNQRSAITSDDIAPIGSILQSFNGVEIIDFLIHSPGGDGNTGRYPIY